MSRRLRETRRSPEAGFAVPTVTLMLLAAMALAGVAVSASIGGQRGVVRDRDTKSALAVAESGVAGADLALLAGLGVGDDERPDIGQVELAWVEHLDRHRLVPGDHVAQGRDPGPRPGEVGHDHGEPAASRVTGEPATRPSRRSENSHSDV